MPTVTISHIYYYGVQFIQTDLNNEALRQWVPLTECSSDTCVRIYTTRDDFSNRFMYLSLKKIPLSVCSDSRGVVHICAQNVVVKFLIMWTWRQRNRQEEGEKPLFRSPLSLSLLSLLSLSLSMSLSLSFGQVMWTAQSARFTMAMCLMIYWNSLSVTGYTSLMIKRKDDYASK